MKTKLFLSNSEIVDGQFIEFCHSNKIELHAKSLIDFEEISFNPGFTADVVFFSSPRSVDYFIDSVENGSYCFACLGAGTAKRLESYGHQADFVGSASGNPEMVASEFRKWLADRKVVFPLSERSNRSISSVIPDSQKTELIVYKTVSVPETLEKCQIYVFTSPSNVDSFLEKNSIPSDSQIIAWGRTTAKWFSKLGIPVACVLEKSDLRELENYLKH